MSVANYLTLLSNSSCSLYYDMWKLIIIGESMQTITGPVIMVVTFLSEITGGPRGYANFLEENYQSLRSR